MAAAAALRPAVWTTRSCRPSGPKTCAVLGRDEPAGRLAEDARAQKVRRLGFLCMCRGVVGAIAPALDLVGVEVERAPDFSCDGRARPPWAAWPAAASRAAGSPLVKAQACYLRGPGVREWPGPLTESYRDHQLRTGRPGHMYCYACTGVYCHFTVPVSRLKIEAVQSPILHPNLHPPYPCPLVLSGLEPLSGGCSAIRKYCRPHALW